MAVKSKSDGGERSNRFRFVMLDADLSDANVNALAQAIFISWFTRRARTGV